MCRGLHFQTGVHSQSKLISIVKGKKFLIFADIKGVDSETYGQYFLMNYHPKKRIYFYTQKGFAHGYLSLILKL
ncbi:MAG: hypothetical protein CM15mP36_13160 [Flavobacteriales bacterium]|nr:MAG: hypothetical protein CM15mP36_13160 [Flavobacteriales bacterium]